MSFNLKILTRNVLNIGVFGVFVAPTLLGGVMSYKNGRGFVSGALIGSAATGSVMALVCGITYKIMLRIMEGRGYRALNNAIPQVPLLQQAGFAVVQAHFGGMEEQVPKG